jgi:nickel-dependent lactate racemase
MVEVWLPYGSTEVVARIQYENLMSIYRRELVNSVKDFDRSINQSIDNALGVRLEDLVRNNKKAVIIVEEPQSRLLRQASTIIRSRIIELGILPKNVLTVWGVLNQLSDPEKLVYNTNGDIRERHHDFTSNLTRLGKSTFRKKVEVNKAIATSNLRITVSEVRPHPLTGYTGGGRAILSVSGLSTMKRIISKINNPKVRAGITHNNPVFESINELGEIASINFSLNIVLNTERKLVAAYAGDFEESFFNASKLSRSISEAKIEKQSDIVLVSAGGLPWDSNLVSALNAVDMVQPAVKDDGIIILLAECLNGHGSEALMNLITKYDSSKDIFRSIRKQYSLGAEVAYRYMRCLEKNQITLVATLPSYYSQKNLRLTTADTINEALEMALKKIGRRSKVAVFPQGSNTIPLLKM